MFLEHEPKLELNSGNHSFFDGNKKAAPFTGSLYPVFGRIGESY